ncbi:hypothetical protein M0R04_10730 [Candidatus Dojkabacteria bacterium]|jgi:hypothetical protein|nr:hypothetical protein [Candidatus Dojkabacteria bacterium]
MKDKKVNNNWENSEYSDLIRIKPEDKEYIKTVKGDLSMAGFLHFIIQTYKANNK